MAIQLSVAVRNGMLDSIETTVGTSPKLQFRTGSPPADCATADSGSLLAELTLPSDWLGAAASGTKSLAGTWQANASGAGTAGHYRIKNSAGSTTHEQGTITATGGGGDLTIDNTTIASGQQITVTAYSRTAGNA